MLKEYVACLDNPPEAVPVTVIVCVPKGAVGWIVKVRVWLEQVGEQLLNVLAVTPEGRPEILNVTFWVVPDIRVVDN